MEKKVDVCCHCGKKVGGYYVNPDGYYYVGASFIGCSAEPPDYKYRLCVDCFKTFKEVVSGFFKTEGE